MTRRKTHEEFVKEAIEIIGDDYIILSEYTNSFASVKLSHKCGTEFPGIPANILSRGTKCPTCFPKSKTRIQNQLKKFEITFNEIAKDEYELLSDYKGQTKEIMVRHKLCGKTYPTTPHRFINDENGCYECSYIKRGEKRRVAVEDVKQRIKNKYGGKIIIFDGYCGIESQCNFKCMECNIIFSTKPSILLMESVVWGCPKCSRTLSRGEEKIHELLRTRNLEFSRQFSFRDLVCKNILKFDFAIFNNGSVKCLIEFDGEQHYGPVSVFGGVEGYYKTITRDILKNNYCTDKGIKLIRIPYWEFDNIEKILETEVSGF